jgi:hypothetical protein
LRLDAIAANSLLGWWTSFAGSRSKIYYTVFWVMKPTIFKGYVGDIME